MKLMVRFGAVLLLAVFSMGALTAAQRHWVGTGSGQGKDWNRAANWSTTQGGAGGASVPTAADDVFIDGGGGLLTINVAAVCLSFTQTQAGHTTNFLGSGSMIIGTGGFHLSAGTFDISNNNNISVAGDWIVTGGTFSSGTSTLTFNGTTPQTFVSGSSLYNQVINNSSGLILGSNLTVTNTLTLTSGPVVTGPYSVIVSPGGSIVQTGGYISGNLSKYVAAGATTVNFELGGGGSTSTVTVAFGNVTTDGYLTASSTSGDHPSLGTSLINPNYSVNRYWTLANTGIVFDSYSATFNYSAGEIDASADPNTFFVNRYASAAWTGATVGARTATSTQATGLTAFGDFAVGTSAVFHTITASAQAGGTISPSGAVSVLDGSSQAFTITANTGYHIDSVVVDGANQGVIAGYTFNTVTANHAIAAYFSIDVFTIGASASAGGSISPSGSVDVNYGANQAFSVTPNTGYHVDSVVVDGVNQGAATGHTFNNVTANHTIAAYFSINVYSITATSSAGGGISPSGTVNLNHGDNQSYTMTPDTGYHIDSVVVDGVNQGAGATYDFTSVDASHTIDAFFSINVYSITSTSSAGGSISPSGTVNRNHGDDQSYTITPDAGYHTDSVVVDGLNQGVITSFDFTSVSADHTIDAYFSVDMYEITATAGGGGDITPSGVVPVAHGADQAFTITPAAGYFISDVHVDTVSVGALGGYTFTNVTAEHSIEAFFAVRTFTISASAGPNGSISPVGDTVVNYGQSVGYTITPATGYYVVDVFVDSVSVGPVGSYSFNDVDADHSIQAQFAIQTFTVKAAAGPNGSIAPAGTSTVNYGGTLNYTVAPNTGYYIADVHVDSVSVGAVPNYSFTNVTGDHTIEAYFSITAYTITATSTGGGTIAPSGPVGVNHGEDRSFTMTADPGHHLDSVVVDGVNQGAAASYSFTNVTSSHTIAAYFSVNIYAITSSAGTGGGISPSGVISVAHGSDLTFTVTPNTGYFVQDVHVDTVSVGAVSSYTFTNVTADHSIEAFFAVQTFSVTALAGPNGTVSPSGTTVVQYGDTLEITVTPDSGFFVSDVHVDSIPVGAVTSYTFYNITTDHLLEAAFGTNAPPTGPGLVSPVDGDTIPSGLLGAVTFTWNASTDPDAGDTLSYALHITGPGVEYTASGLSDTAVTVDLSAVLVAGDAYTWTVSVSDGRLSVASPDTFGFLVNPSTGVGDEAGVLPKVYALRQNYPNPFNPTTAIPFDLPERSVVTLKVYNVLGVEVMEIVGGESLEAGSYKTRVDFSGLSSGAYFYRLSARGESGATFGKVLKMVVLK